MQNRILATILGLLLFLPVPVIGGSGWTDYVPVLELTATSQYRYLVRLKVSENPSGCKNKETFYQDYEVPGSVHMFNTLLEAIASEKFARVYVTGKCGLDGYSEISSVSIMP